jgi:hypothetical protein
MGNNAPGRGGHKSGKKPKVTKVTDVKWPVIIDDDSHRRPPFSHVRRHFRQLSTFHDAGVPIAIIDIILEYFHLTPSIVALCRQHDRDNDFLTSISFMKPLTTPPTSTTTITTLEHDSIYHNDEKKRVEAREAILVSKPSQLHQSRRLNTPMLFPCSDSYGNVHLLILDGRPSRPEAQSYSVAADSWHKHLSIPGTLSLIDTLGQTK